MRTPESIELGEALRAVRAAKGMSLAKVEEMSGGVWKAVVVGSYERGERNITVPRLVRLASFYGADVASLLPGRGPTDSLTSIPALISYLTSLQPSARASE